jgi:hypothetical protein
MDFSDGRLLWPKVVTLFVVSVLIPLAMPRQYTPVDPKVKNTHHLLKVIDMIQNPMPETNPEQTASILSLALYSFLDPIIFLAYRIPHLKFEQFPPLCDYDAAENLKARAFPVCSVSTCCCVLLTSLAPGCFCWQQTACLLWYCVGLPLDFVSNGHTAGNNGVVSIPFPNRAQQATQVMRFHLDLRLPY